MNERTPRPCLEPVSTRGASGMCAMPPCFGGVGRSETRSAEGTS